jgi:hypothetical protein
MLPAAQPQTLFKTTRTVPSLFTAESTSSVVIACAKPTLSKSARIGATNSGGYIVVYFFVITKVHSSLFACAQGVLNGLKL